MIFKKVVIDGKEYYQREDSEEKRKKEEAQVCSEVKEEFIEGVIADSGTSNSDESFSKDAQEFFERIGEGAKNVGGKIVDGAKDIGKKIADGAKDLGKKIKEGTENLFGRDKSFDSDSTEAKLLKLLPYMDKEETHSIVEKIVANDEAVASLDIATIMPFISSEDADALFMKILEIGNENCDIPKALPYVSAECLNRIVTGYIEGKYDGLEIDTLYPVLPEKEIKRIFYHIIKNDANNDEM